LKTDEVAKYFHFNDLIIKLHPEVYDPAEDTFLLIEAINVAKGDCVLDIGTGCGLIALECARLGANVICTDINPYAVKLAKNNYLKNKFKIIRADTISIFIILMKLITQVIKLPGFEEVIINAEEVIRLQIFLLVIFILFTLLFGIHSIFAHKEGKTPE